MTVSNDAQRSAISVMTVGDFKIRLQETLETRFTIRKSEKKWKNFSRFNDVRFFEIVCDEEFVMTVGVTCRQAEYRLLVLLIKKPLAQIEQNIRDIFDEKDPKKRPTEKECISEDVIFYTKPKAFTAKGETGTDFNIETSSVSAGRILGHLFDGHGTVVFMEIVELLKSISGQELVF